MKKPHPKENNLRCHVPPFLATHGAGPSCRCVVGAVVVSLRSQKNKEYSRANRAAPPTVSLGPLAAGRALWLAVVSSWMVYEWSLCFSCGDRFHPFTTPSRIFLFFTHHSLRSWEKKRGRFAGGREGAEIIIFYQILVSRFLFLFSLLFPFPSPSLRGREGEGQRKEGKSRKSQTKNEIIKYIICYVNIIMVFSVLILYIKYDHLIL
jgi:hypothetical protein